MFERVTHEPPGIFASEARSAPRFIEIAVDSANQVREQSAAIVAAVISRLDEIVAEGLARGGQPALAV